MIILHIGFPKTATTSLQRLFRDNQICLRNLGIYYPLVDEDFKQRCLKDLLPRKGHKENPINAAAERRLQHLKHLIMKSDDHAILLSCEELTNDLEFELGWRSLTKLRNFFSEVERDIQIVVYVRNPVDYYLSRMQEVLKSRSRIISPDRFNSRMAWVISQYEIAFDTPLRVRTFAPAGLVGGSVSSDFWSSIHDIIRVDPSELIESKVNESLSAEVMWVLDALREYPESQKIPVRLNSGENRILWRNLQQIDLKMGTSGKPKLYACAAREVSICSSIDTAKLAEKYKVYFGDHCALDIDNPLPKDRRLVPVEGIVPVDRERALALIAVVAARGIKAIAGSK